MKLQSFLFGIFLAISVVHAAAINEPREALGCAADVCPNLSELERRSLLEPRAGGCQQVSKKGTSAVKKQFPGVVTKTGCFVGGCKCGGDRSDHCCGKAVDLHVKVRSANGRKIAEWVMKNRKKLKLKYVIWGQRIWNPSRDKQKSWSKWRLQRDLGSITKNHWDHVHISFK